MLIAIAIVCIFVLIIISKLIKKTPQIEEGEDYNPIYDDEDLAYLKVFYKYNEIQPRQEITTYETFSCFKVEGYNLKGYRKVLYPEKMTWSCACGCVKFESQTGLENCISCKTKGDYKRNISIKYQNSVNFSFRLIFK